MKKRFLEAISTYPPDFDTARELLRGGLDINEGDPYYGNLLSEALFDVYSACTDENSERCQECDDEYCIYCDRKRKPDFISVINFFVENGWDSVRHALSTVAELVHTTHDTNMLYAAKRLLELPLPDSKKEYEKTLSSIGSEESYQRVCEENHEEENIYFAMYEMVEARCEGRDFSGIHPYHRAIGRKIDAVLYFSDKLDFAETQSGIEFGGDFGFLCDEELLLISNSINVLFDNVRIKRDYYISCPDVFGAGIIGSTITDISFEHKVVEKKNTHYGQATIVIKLDSGKEIRFTHNFGEQDEGYTSRFIPHDSHCESKERTDHIFALSSSQNFSADKLESYIINAKPTSDEITLAAIRLVESFSGDAYEFKEKNNREPCEYELISSNFVPVFEVLLKYGLAPTRVYRKGGEIKNLLMRLLHCDNKHSYYKSFRLLFESGIDPHFVVDDEDFFEFVESNVITDATLLEIEGADRAVYEREFRLWLLMIAYGADPGKLSVNECFDVKEFKNCEDFSYRMEFTEKDWFLRIYMTKNGREVAVL